MIKKKLKERTGSVTPERLQESGLHRPVGEVDVEHQKTGDGGVAEEGQDDWTSSANLWSGERHVEKQQ